MAETWMTYTELAERLGVSPEAARQKAIRGRWRRQTGNDGRALVLVEPEAIAGRKARKQTPVEQPDKQVYEHPSEHPDNSRTVEALNAHISTLKDNLAKAEALATARDDDVRRERERIDKLTTELLRVTAEMMAAAAARDSLRTELEEIRARPWWRRLSRLKP